MRRAGAADAEGSHLRVKLLLGARVAILAAVSAVTLGRFPPLVPVFHARTGRRPAGTVTVGSRRHEARKPAFQRSLPVFELSGVPSAIPAVVIVGASVTLSA